MWGTLLASLISVVTFAVKIAVPVAIGVMLSPTLRKEGSESLSNCFSASSKWAHAQRVRAKAAVRDIKERRRAKAKAKTTPIPPPKSPNIDAYTALSVAWMGKDGIEFERLKQEYSDDPTVQRFAVNLLKTQQLDGPPQSDPPAEQPAEHHSGAA